MQKSTTFTTIFRVKKCHFHYAYAKKNYLTLKYPIHPEFTLRYVFRQTHNDSRPLPRRGDLAPSRQRALLEGHRSRSDKPALAAPPRRQHRHRLGRQNEPPDHGGAGLALGRDRGRNPGQNHGERGLLPPGPARHQTDRSGHSDALHEESGNRGVAGTQGCGRRREKTVEG
jgi:hypothetical protein